MSNLTQDKKNNQSEKSSAQLKIIFKLNSITPI